MTKLPPNLYPPSDVYLAKGDKFTEWVFEAPTSPILAQARFSGKPVTVHYGNLLATLSGIQKDGDFRNSALRFENGTSVVAKLNGVSSTYAHAWVQFVRLDPKTSSPQVVFGSFSGGAHCCTTTQIITSAGQIVDAGVIDGEGYSFEDIDGDGHVEILGIDNSFLYMFDAYATSYAPPRVQRLVEGKLLDVTREPTTKPYIQRSLREMQFQAAQNPSLWSSNGYLGGWVATKALLGEVEDAWQRMLSSYSQDSFFNEEECSISVKIDRCPPNMRHRIPFPVTLQKHLVKHGYPVPNFAPVQPSLPPQPAPAMAAKEPPPARSGNSLTGSSFFITPEGHLLTNAHVVEDCNRISVSYGLGEARTGRVIGRDEINDLAIVKVDAKPEAIVAFRSGVRLGESIAVYGFPLFGLLASGGNFTLGNVTALAGLHDDSRILQISAPVQPGNSGGPLLDESGFVVGIVVSKLNAIKLALATSDLSQNINFAIKASTALAFAETQGLKPRMAPPNGATLRPADLADLAKSVTALIECQR